MPTSKPGAPEREPPTKNEIQKIRRIYVRRITRPDPGSLYDIMHDNAGTSLYVVPICWTDLHSRLLGAQFTERPVVKTPVPDLVPGSWLEPSRMAQTLTSELHTLVREDTSPRRASSKNRAIKHVMSTLFPTTLSRAKTGAELNLYFGQRVYRKVVRIPCLWKRPSNTETSFDSCPTMPSTSFTHAPKSAREAGVEYVSNMPILAYINKSQLAAVRASLYGVVRGPYNNPNHAVAGLQRLRSKMLIPENADHDPYIVAILLAMAQARFYREPSSRASSQPQPGSQGRKPIRMPPPIFRDVKVQVITHDEGNDSTPNFVVYTATVTVAFLERFMFPHKALTSKGPQPGMKITHTPVTFWPILGLKERLAKALGREAAGDPMYDDPEHIALWDPLLQPEVRPVYHHRPIASVGSIKRRRHVEKGPLADVLNSSFEDESPSSSDDRPVLSPAAKRRRTAGSVNPLEVC